MKEEKNKTLTISKKPIAKAKSKKTPTETAKKESKNFDVFDTSGTKIGKQSIPEYLLTITASPKLLSLYVRVFLSNTRRGLAIAKTRGEVEGSTRKIYRQKGTGRARHGDKKAPIFVGGGKAHGPGAQNYSLKLNKKQRKKALLYALSLKVKNNNVHICKFQEKPLTKTKEASVLIDKLVNDKSSACVVFDMMKERQIGAPFSNISSINVVNSSTLNAFQIIKHDTIIFSDTAFNTFVRIHKI